MEEFVFKTREEFKKLVKLTGDEPINYIILEEQPKTQYLTTEDKKYLDEDNISTHTLEETTTSEQQQEEPEHIANATDSEEEQEPTEEEQEPTEEEEQEPTDDEQLNIKVINTEGETHDATKLLNGDYEANKFIDYLLFENAHKDEKTGQNLVSDVGGINPTKYYTEKNKKLQPITPPFVDTLMLFKLIDEQNTVKQNGTVLIDKEICGLWNTKIRKTAKKYNIELPKHGVVCKKTN